MARDRVQKQAPPRDGDPERSEGSPSRGGAPEPEVPERAKRRRFTAAYKQRILEEADRARQPGEVGAMLRREGLYSSHLTAWRKQLRAHGTAGLAGRRRGPAPKPKASARERQLERENKKLEKKLAHAELVIEFQKKVHALLGIPLKPMPSDEDDS